MEAKCYEIVDLEDQLTLLRQKHSEEKTDLLDKFDQDRQVYEH